MYMSSRRITALLSMAALQALSTAHADEYNPVAHEPRAAAATASVGVIVKLRATSGIAQEKLGTLSDRGRALGKRTGVSVTARREISSSMLATVVSTSLGTEEALERLRADPEVEYAVIDHRRYAHATNPDDPLFSGQWYLKFTEMSAVNAIGAWDTEKGSNGVVVAVLDTGVLYDHPDLGRGDHDGKLLPGYDFVSNVAQANDGNGPDPDPSDPGDWINDADLSNAAFSNCEVAGSSWHGTRVAGMIGALTNNGSGVAGLSWNSFILPVRVLGKCGGPDSDVIAGMRWAAGLTVPGAPVNPTPARIINMSLGSGGACEPSYQDVIRELTARKVLVVISAGNEGTVVSSPANCAGVAAVAAIRHAGSKVGFSSLGPEVTIAAPGGNCVNVNGGPCLFSLDTTSNNGTTAPGANSFTNQSSFNLGTSFSAPIVSGIAALMLSENNNLSTAQMLARLREGARQFPGVIDDAPGLLACHVPLNDQDFQLEQCLCTTDTCGAGMANAANSVQAAERPIAAVALPASVSPGQNVSLNAAASAAACGRTVSSFAWAVVSPTSNPPTITTPNSSAASVIAPSTGSITLRLTVTDDLGHTDTADVLVESNRATSTAPASAGTTPCPSPVTSGPTPGTPTTPPPVTPPPTTPSKKGGGGSIELLTLTLLGMLAGMRLRQRRKARFFRCI